MARGQGQGRKKSESKDKNNPSEDRPSRGLDQECSRPRTKDTDASVLKKKIFKIFFRSISKKINKSSTKIFWRSTIEENKNAFANFSRGFWRFPTKFQRFKKWCCPRAEDWAIFQDLRLLGQGLRPKWLYFSYSAFWSIGRWGSCSPLALPPGYSTAGYSEEILI